jgi:galactokinase
LIEQRIDSLYNTMAIESHPPKLAKADLTPELEKLVETAKELYKTKLAYFVHETHKIPAFIAAAPGRVNLIGDHTDYNNGFCLPLAIHHSCVVYGTGFVHLSKGTGVSTIRLRMISDRQPEPDVVEERKLSINALYPPDESAPQTWANYVLGVIVQYMPDLPREGCSVDLAMAFASNVPVGAGLSSSASLEVATATFIECFMHDMAFSAAPDYNTGMDKAVERAVRCQRAENEWANSPCGIMDQYASSVAQAGHCMLIDCQSLEVTQVAMKDSPDQPVILITDSKVEHQINNDSEYGKRRHECQDALTAMQMIPLYHVLSLRDATLGDCQTAQEKMGETVYNRAKHVVTENSRAKECKTALKLGMWERVGELMNASHDSLRDDYECSCQEVDYLVALQQAHAGVYGSRMTGGGFGGCTVTLVQKEHVDDLIEALKAGYKENYGKDVDCFVTQPGPGARVLAIDIDCKPE